MRRPILSILSLGLFGIASVAMAQPSSTSTTVVKTSGGAVQGKVASRVDQYLGIPYAAPPVGELRWQPPREPKAWGTVFDARRFGNFCPQENRGVFAAPSSTEDCLYLNVYAPKGSAGKGKRPVMVWFYGGGLFSGESNDYDGSKLARQGDVIVVTFNYRIGALGFMSHPALNGEGHPFANYGIMDQQFALKWVQKNIAAFGGDPGNVTIFGQSGGGTAVMANLVSPTAAGLFQKAINESGTHIAEMPPEAALKAGQDIATAAGCTDQSAACLRGLSVDQVLKNQRFAVALIAPDFVVVDGTIIKQKALDAFSSGNYNRVPILTGLVRDEQAFFLPEANTGVAFTADGYAKDIASFGAANVERLNAKYPLASYASPSLADIDMQEGFKACTARQLDRQWSKYAPVYAYEFDDRTAPSYFRALSYPMRAYHTSELQYIFPLFRGGQGTSHALNKAQSKLSDAMVGYWTSFARSGVPKGAVTWARYAADQDNLMSLDLPSPKPMKGYGKTYDCTLWDDVLAYK